jgi:hypothetical protein
MSKSKKIKVQVKLNASIFERFEKAIASFMTPEQAFNLFMLSVVGKESQND